ncbi:MAG: hypothetical protein AAF561_10425, partial [Planctomycetota bacterium]
MSRASTDKTIMEEGAEAIRNMTTLHPLGLAAVVVAGVSMLLVDRRYVLWPVIAIVCFVASAQRVVIFGADFTFLRLMVMCGLIRALAFEPWHRPRWNRLDVIVLLWAAVAFSFPLVRLVTGGGGDLMSSAVYRAGQTFDAVGMYFVFRLLVRSWDDALSAIKGLTLALIVMAPFFIAEWLTRFNAFSIFGGVPEMTMIRNDRLRCQGAFSH